MSDKRIPINGLPDGVIAVAITRSDGSFPRDRRGRAKTTHVRLAASVTGATPRMPIDGFAANDTKWILGKSRRYQKSVEQRFGPAAWDIAMRLTAAGVVEVLCAVGDDLRLGAMRHWELTAAWDTHRLEYEDSQRIQAETWRSRAQTAADSVEAIDPDLSEVLRRASMVNPRLAVLVHAAEDLVDGISHDGPRAFSQTHFGGTKDRDDVAKILAACSVRQASLIALGLLRSPYIGLGGSVTVQDVNGDRISLSGLTGPVRFRATGLAVIAPRATTTVVVENLQAAEAVCDRFPGVAVAWCAGQPADVVLDLVTMLATDAQRVIVATDADLGGVRIANRVVAALAGHPNVLVLDAGAHPHPPRRPFGEASIIGLTAQAAGNEQVAQFARACLNRGYPVEQEATIRTALNAVLE